MKNIIKLAEGVPELVENDPWVIVDESHELLPGERAIYLANTWICHQSEKVLSGNEMSSDGILFKAEDKFDALLDALPCIPLIAIDFPSFRDGRGYSQAYLLRARHGWEGELRAVGDVLRDQLSHMRQCGFTSFAVRPDKSASDALKGLTGISVLYGRSAIEPKPLYRRR